MDRDMTNFVPQVGMEVVGADGDKVGEIDAVERDYFMVRQGFFFPQDHYIPLTAISSFDEDGRVYLRVTKDEALQQEWGNPPAAAGEISSDMTAGQHDFGTVGEDQAYRDTADLNRTSASATTRSDDIGYVEEAVIPVHEEELTARTHEVERGEVRVHKDVIEEQRTLEVPVTEEEVEITRRHVDRAVTDADHAFEEGTIEVPLRGEEVDIEKRTRVVEEIDIDKTAREHTEVVDGTVRREEVHIEGDNIDVHGDEPRRRDNDLI